jgi:hypothetical protein
MGDCALRSRIANRPPPNANNTKIGTLLITSWLSLPNGYTILDDKIAGGVGRRQGNYESSSGASRFKNKNGTP